MSWWSALERRPRWPRWEAPWPAWASRPARGWTPRARYWLSRTSRPDRDSLENQERVSIPGYRGSIKITVGTGGFSLSHITHRVKNTYREVRALEHTTQEKVKILVVDDHAIVREGTARMLELTPEFQVVGQASSAREGMDMVRSLKPEIVLMDIRMPGINGIEATRMIKNEFQDVEVIVLSMYDEEEYVVEAVAPRAIC
ncbi:MAG: response regulator transcription factor [Armatimonadetes bacterium]|nr:response regulator transcription factor [Armatimonadota bacterium]